MNGEAVLDKRIPEDEVDIEQARREMLVGQFLIGHLEYLRAFPYEATRQRVEETAQSYTYIKVWSLMYGDRMDERFRVLDTCTELLDDMQRQRLAELVELSDGEVPTEDLTELHPDLQILRGAKSGVQKARDEASLGEGPAD